MNEDDSAAAPAAQIAAQTAETARGVFADLAPLDQWVPYAARPSARRPGKVDKIPSNGTVGLSTARPADWCGLDEALGLSMVHPDLNGVGLVMTGGIEQDGLLLIGFDFDGLDAKRPIKAALDEIEAIAGYVELSPSGNGLRAFAWVPKAWTEKYKDSMKAHPGFCDHAEIYFGTSPRFLTVTFNAQRTAPIKTVDEKAWKKIEAWGLTLRGAERDAAAPVLDTGSPLELDAYTLTDKQRKLLSGQPVPNRSDTLHGLVISLAEQGAPPEDVLATITSNPHLWTYCLDHRHEDPERALKFATEEVQRGIAHTKAARLNRLSSINENWKPKATVKSPTPAKPEAPPCWPPPGPGPMADAVDAMLGVAPKPQFELTTMAMLIAMASICGSYYRLPGGGGLNLFACCIGETGCGKDAPLRLSTGVALQGRVRLLGKPASGQGLEDALVDHEGTFIEIDELAHFFAAVNASRAPAYLIDLTGNLLRLFTAANGVYRKRARADQTEIKVIKSPAVSLLGCSTPEKLGEAVSVGNVADGLLGRFLFAFGREGLSPRLVRERLELPDTVKSAARLVAMGRNFNLLRGPTAIAVEDSAELMFGTLLADFDKRGRASTSPLARSLFQRSFEKTERIAGVLAVWDNPAKPVINLEHVTWAAQAVRASDAAVLRFSEGFLHGGQVQGDAAKLRTLIPRIVSGELTTVRAREQEVTRQGWAPRSMLLRASKLDRGRFDIALAHLEGLGDVRFQTFQGEHPNGREERLQAVRGSTE